MKQVILITGASSGMGRDGALRLAQAGHRVYATSNDISDMEELAAHNAKVKHLDVTDNATMVSCVNDIIETEGKIDVLINNAGYGSYGALEDVPLDEARKQFEVNVFGLARLTQLVLPHMRKAKSGKIVNVSSVGGVGSEPHSAWYHASKFAVEGMSDCLRQELIPFGIDVVVIQPGAIRSEWNEIARKNLLQVSGHTAYGELVQKHAKLLERIDEDSSDPGVIGKLMVEIVETRHPNTRYARGKNARAALIIRRLFTDKMYDRFMMQIMK
ncbi:SDR family NAD(P)-dependent oxidoreductase [bacterium SCSIO 12741]|nr:SDR family NAD(P)-dependent oxidoreductase [bacterium SCSIO 12741]